jgi:hypothetical protein
MRLAELEQQHLVLLLVEVVDLEALVLYQEMLHIMLAVAVGGVLQPLEFIPLAAGA